MKVTFFISIVQASEKLKWKKNKSTIPKMETCNEDHTIKQNYKSFVRVYTFSLKYFLQTIMKITMVHMFNCRIIHLFNK